MKAKAALKILLVLAFWPSFALADGVIIIDYPRPVPMPRPRPVPPPRPLTPLAIKQHHVNVEIERAVAFTTVDQVFYNPNSVQLEGTYIFPIPRGAAVRRFIMFMNGKEVEAELLDAERARKIYEDIVRRKRDPALLEYYGRGMLKARVFPVPARGDVRIKISYHEMLKPDGGLVKYLYPLNTEKFSSTPIQSVSVRVEINAGRPMSTIYSPSHKVEIKREGPQKAVVGFEQSNVKPDTDFQLYYLLEETDVGMHVMSYADGSEDGTFLLLIAPGASGPAKTIPKDIVFVFDTSGSMSGRKIEQARRALAFCLNGLNPKDRFNLVTFSTEANSYRDGLVEVRRKEVRAAVEYVNSLDARGGTNLHEALIMAFKNEPRQGRPFMIVLMTDGLPTVGVTGEKDILRRAKEANRARARVFAFGVGYDVNTHLLDGLAEEHNGVSEYVRPEEDLELKISSFYTKIASPVMTNLELTIKGVETYDLYPKKPGDLFRGGEILVLGRYRNAGAASVTLSGLYSGEKRTFSYEPSFPGMDRKYDFLPRLWATRKVGYLLRQIRLHGASRELKDEVTRLAKRYGLLTPYTSMLILEDEDRRLARGAGGRTVDQNSLSRIARPAAKEMSAMSGADAFKSARRQGTMLRQRHQADEAPEMDAESRRTIKRIKRQVGSHTFYLTNGVWVDSRYTGGTKTVKVKYLSKRYFELLRLDPETARAFSLGERIIVVIRGIAYEVVKG